LDAEAGGDSVSALDPHSPLNAELVPLKKLLEGAKSRLTRREWAALMAILAFYVESQFPHEEREAAVSE
jgi:hypothetical protein